MSDINAIVQASLQSMFESGKVNEMIEKQLEATIKEIIVGTLREHSDFGKALRKAIEAQLPTSFNSLDMANYNAFIVDAVGRKLQLLASDDWRKQIEGLLDQMFEPFKGQLTITEICRTMQKHFKDDITCACDGGNFTFLVERDGSFVHLYIDEGEDREKYRCKYQIHARIDREAGENIATVYSVRVDDEDPEKKLFRGPYYGVEKLLMALFHGKTQLVVDVEHSHELDTSLSDYD